ncbi:MAG: kdpA, partial [candidate division NC10 bacterium]|nr:kdpA [candidate division NC10 bacterium]
MTANSYLQLTLYFGVLFALVKPVGAYMARVYEDRPILLRRILWPVERMMYRAAGIRPDVEMDWRSYALAMLAFSMFGVLSVYLLQRVQGWLPLNPENLNAVAPHLAFNTAASFASNTNWQSYGGETTLSYLIVRRSAQTIGNFWVDLVRSTLYILLPLSLVGALLLVSQGVVQTFQPYVKVSVL